MKNTDPPPQREPDNNHLTPTATKPSSELPARDDAAAQAQAAASPPSDEEILSGLDEAADLIRWGQVHQVFLASQWGHTHLADPVPNFLRDHGLSPQDDEWYHIHLAGFPYVDDYSIPAFAQAARMSEYQARKLIRTSLMLTTMLPRVWGKAVTGHIHVFQAQLLAQECWDLTPEAVAYIDAAMAHTQAIHTPKGRENIVRAAKIRHMPDTAAREDAAALERRNVVVDTRDHDTGLANVSATMNLPAGIALDAALTRGAAILKEMGCEESIGVRRTYALEDLLAIARTHADCADTRSAKHAAGGAFRAPTTRADDDTGTGARGEGTGGKGRPHWDGAGVPATRVRFFVHLTPTNDGVSSGVDPVARVTGTDIPAAGIVTSTQMVRAWFTRPRAGKHPGVRITGVVNLNNEVETNAYAPTEAMKTHLYLRDGMCVFPYCTQDGIRTDCDHVNPWATDRDGHPVAGATCTCNCASLCRRHHNVKTHGKNATNGVHTNWSYTVVGDGKFLWTGPIGKQLLRTPAGTFAVTTACIHTNDAGLGERVWTVTEVIASAVKAHRSLWENTTHRLEVTAATAAAANEEKRQAQYRNGQHPSHTVSTTTSAAAAAAAAAASEREVTYAGRFDGPPPF